MAGIIRKKGQHSWQLVYDVGRDAEGRRIRRWVTVRGSFKEAEQQLTHLLSQRDQGFDVAPNRLTVEQFLARWLAAHNVTDQSRTRYQQLIRRHILPSLGAMKLAAVKPLHVQSLLTEAEANVSASTAHDVYTLLHTAFAQAVKWQLLGRNPADAVERPRVEEPDAMRVLSADEIEALLAAADGTPFAPVIALALETGIRRGEALALKWPAVDLDAGTIEILENARFVKGRGVVYGPPKTRKSRRVIALSRDTVAMLRAHKRQQNERRLRWGPAWGNSEELVFTNEIGEPRPLGSFNRQFNQLVAGAGIVGAVRFHDLRHTHGTLLAQVADPKLVSDRLGHSDVKFTLNRYVNPTHDHQRAAAEAFSALLKRAR
jgi:integrase